MARRLVLATVGAAGYFAFVQWWNPFAPHSLGCPFHAVTGLWCPGCGSTRAAYELMHGRFFEAVQNNVLLPVALLVLGYCAVYGASRIPARWIRVGGVAVMAFAVARNLAPLSFLAPVGAS